MSNEILLKYGCNPHQNPSKIYKACREESRPDKEISTAEGEEGRPDKEVNKADGKELPFEVLNGRPGYINFLDALNAWQLVKELKAATGYPAAASFKHVSPAGAAIGIPLSEELKKIYFIRDNIVMTPLACAYARARGADRMSSFGDFIALSDVCDEAAALLIKPEVSDGIIAPGYTKKAREILFNKKKGSYNVIQVDESYVPGEIEKKEVFGVVFEQRRNDAVIDESLLTNVVTENKEIPEKNKLDLLIAMITLKYTQSNSVCYVLDGQVIGVGAGQQSRIHCTRLAGQKADTWFLRQHPYMLNLKFKEGLGRAERDNAIDNIILEGEEFFDHYDYTEFFVEKPNVLSKKDREEWLAKMKDVSLSSDAFFPFGDNIERAVRSGVRYIVQPGGSIRDDNVIDTCNKYGIAMAFNNLRLFHH